MKKPITIMVIIHNDLNNHQKTKLFADYFSWLKTELQLISGRNVLFLLYAPDEVPKMSGYNYKNDDLGVALAGWKSLTNDFFRSIVAEDQDQLGLTKILLLTRDNINSGTGGVAELGKHCAIASINFYQVAAHETGHMFGATHEDSEVFYDGWWHDSIMLVDGFTPLRGNTYRFSDKNRENIRKYLDRFP